MKVIYKGNEIELDDSNYENDIDLLDPIEDFENTIEISDEELEKIKMRGNDE